MTNSIEESEGVPVYMKRTNSLVSAAEDEKKVSHLDIDPEDNDDSDLQFEQDQPGELDVPDGGYGWVIVVALFLFNFSTWGSNASFAVFLAHYLNYDVFPGTTRVEYGAVGGLCFGSGLMLAPFLSYAVGLVGLHAVIALGVLIQFVGLMLASWSTKIWELFMTQGLMLGIGLASVAVPNLSIMPQWFRKKRSLAIGLTAAGSGLGGVCFVLGLQHLIEAKSYNWALRVQAIVCAVAQVIALVLTRTRSLHIKPEYKLIDKLTMNFGFLMEVLWVSTTMFGYVVLLYNLADFTVSLGYSSQQSSIVSTMISVGAFFFRPVVGRLCDRWGPVTVTIFINLFVCILALAMWIPARNLATPIAFAVMEGGTMGTVWVIAAPVTTRIAGLRKMGSAMGTLWIFIGITGMVSPIVGIVLKESPANGQGVDPTQYVHPAIFVGCSYFAAAVCLFVLRGWIIARDELMMQKNGVEALAEDTGEELLLTVPIASGFRNCFRLKVPKKV